MFEKRYELNGLFIWFLGMMSYIASMILSAIVSGSSGDAVASLVITLLQMAALVVMLVGIINLKAYSQHFVAAFKLLICAIAGIVIGLALMLVFIANPYMGDSIVLLAIFIILAGYVCLMLTTRFQILGMSAIALQNGNYELADKIKNLWKLYCISVGIFGGFGLIFVITVISNPGLLYGYGDGEGILLLSALGLLGGAIFMMVVRVLWAVRAKTLHDLYNGALISPAGSGESMGIGYGTPAVPATPVSTPQTDSSGRIEPMHYGTYGSHASMAPQQSAAPAPVVEPVVEPIAEAPVAESVVEPIAEAPVVEPVVEPIAEAPVVEPMIEPIVDEPAVEPLAEAPADEPVLDPYAETPVDKFFDNECAR